MSLNTKLALVATILWLGTFVWYFRGSARIKRDLLNFVSWFRLRSKDASK